MTGHLSIVQRWKIITLYFDNKLPLREIARLLECSCSTVKCIINLFQETKNVLERQGRGRIAIIRGPARRQFRRLMSRYPTSTSSSVATRLQSGAGILVSARTIRRVRRLENYHPVHAKIQWKINEQQASRRYEYACTHEEDNWKNVIFTDEKQFRIDESGTVFWIPVGGRRPKLFVGQTRYYVNVFGAIWYYGRSHLVFIPGKSNTETYLQHLQLAINDYLPDLHQHFLIHDRTTWSHTHMAHNWLIDNSITCLDDYPSVSPELNAIESVWGWMRNFVQSHHPKTQKQLENVVLKAWQQIPVSIIQAYIDRIRSIVEQIILADGWDIDN